MGFGMQNWIFRQRPRRAFSKKRKSFGDTVPRKVAKDFYISGRTQKDPVYGDQDKIYYLGRIRNRLFKDKIISLLISLILLSIGVALYIYQPWKHFQISNEEFIAQQIKAIQEQREIFQMSVDYGNYYLASGEIASAINEFKHALKIFAENQEANEGLARAYLEDCLTNDKNCENASVLLDSLIAKYPYNSQYLSYKISLENKLENELRESF